MAPVDYWTRRSPLTVAGAAADLELTLRTAFPFHHPGGWTIASEPSKARRTVNREQSTKHGHRWNGSGGATDVGNPNLLPESAQGWEAGFTTTLPPLHRANFVSFGATYFNEKINNLILAVDMAAVDTAENIGSAHTQGVETELTLHAARWLLLQATWTYTCGRDADDNPPLLLRPAQSASLDATITPMPELTIVPELLDTGAFQNFFVNNSRFSTSDVVPSPHGLIVDLTVAYAVAPKVQIYANGTNIFDSKFEPVNG